MEDYENRSSIDTASIQTILERLKLRQGDGSSPLSGIASETRRKRRKKDRRTVRRERKEKYRNLSPEEKADRTRRESSSLRGQYHHLHREIRRRREGKGDPKHRGKCWDWTLTLAEWLEIWSSCPMVNHGFNNLVPAWQLRGRGVGKDVQIKRIDANKPFEINNMTVVKGKLVLYPCSDELT